MRVDNGTRRGPNTGSCEVERFGFEPGPEFTLETFQRYAEDFKLKYFRKMRMYLIWVLIQQF